VADKQEEANHPYSPFAVGGLTLALLAGTAEIIAGLGHRWGIWDYRTGLTTLRWAVYGGGAAGLISLLGAILSRPGGKRRGFILSLSGLLLALLMVGLPWSYRLQARHIPPIHDITTDTENPPRFIAILPLRKEAPNPADYGGPEIAAQQRAAYGDIVPLELSLPAAQAFPRALSAARALGWQIVDVQEQAGRIEATDTTFWFGFKDDVVVQVRATAGVSRIDVRSLSRVGRSDLGTNAKRIRSFLQKIKEMD